jgi:3-isopropylmalate/(R)-2-methylmalate dehydratase small subunit
VTPNNQPLATLRARTMVLPTENIDTDQIIPARFLTTTSRTGLGASLFADWRYDAEGRPRPDSPFDRPEASGAGVLVAGRNFGCGSSREHAVWALTDFGFRAVLSTALADIFRRNALKNGLLAIEIEGAAHARLLAAPGCEVEIDLDSCTVTLPEGERIPFTLDPFARYCLRTGTDELGFLLGQEGAIAAFEAAATAASEDAP